MHRWNRGPWYAHALMFPKDEREIRILVSRFHPVIPIVTIWWWFGDITFGYLGTEKEVMQTIDTYGHDALQTVIKEARQTCDELRANYLTTPTDDYADAFQAWTLANVRYTTLIEAGLIFSLGIPEEQ